MDEKTNIFEEDSGGVETNDELAAVTEFEKGNTDTRQTENVSSVNYRFACASCSGIAFYSAEKSSNVGVCKNCGMSIDPKDKGRFIALTENEKEQLNAL